MTLKDTMMPMMSSFHGSAAAAFGTATASRGFPQPNSPGPNGHDVYSDHGYVEASSPQPSSIQVTMNRVSRCHVLWSILEFPTVKMSKYKLWTWNIAYRPTYPFQTSGC
jgi:hypothetical protein